MNEFNSIHVKIKLMLQDLFLLAYNKHMKT